MHRQTTKAQRSIFEGRATSQWLPGYDQKVQISQVGLLVQLDKAERGRTWAGPA